MNRGSECTERVRETGERLGADVVPRAEHQKSKKAVRRKAKWRQQPEMYSVWVPCEIR